jgi:glyoxylase-like metal-dependent hydrolase (beta-lactamase superfamily II)
MLRKFTLLRFLPTAAACVLLAAAHAEIVSQSPQPMFPGSPLQMWETEKISDDIYAFRYSIYRGLFMLTDAGVIVIDPINVKAATILREEIRKVTDKPVKFVAYSHSHWDHAGGGKLFKDEGATIVAQEQCAANLRENPHPDVLMPDITFRDKYRISLGGKSADLYYYGPSHDNCLVVIQLRPANLLLIVDIANPPSGWHMPYNPTFSEDRVWNTVPVLTAVEDLIRREGIQTVIGGHITTELNPKTGRQAMARGTVGPAATISERREFMQAAIAAVRGELAAGTSPADVPDRLVAKKLLADRIVGYDDTKMGMLLRRMTNYVITGD